MASKFLVVGQKPKDFKDKRMTASVERIRLRSFLGRMTDREGVAFRMDMKDSDGRENPVFNLKVKQERLCYVA